MFLKYLEPIFRPFRQMKSSYLAKKNVAGNFKVEVARAKNMGSQAKQGVQSAQGLADKAGVGGKPGAPGAAPAAPVAPPPKKKGGFMALFGKKKARCQQCGQQQDPSWDQCAYCLQAQQAAQATAGQAHAAAAAAPMKTQAFMVGSVDPGGPPSILGWLVPIKGMQKGELFTLKSVVSIGTDPACDVVLSDSHMSRRHAEIKIQGGSYWLYDLGSTNGTFVNDKKVSQHELVDNDNVRFGQTPVKFKSL